LVAIYNLGRGPYVATVFHFENVVTNLVKVTRYTSPYLEDPHMTSARAVKSTAMIQNATPAMYRMPGIHVLRTSQRFSVQARDDLGVGEMLTIRDSIISNPDTVVLDGAKPVEICNVPNSDTDYYKFVQQEQDTNSYLFKDLQAESGDVNRPMTVIWVAFDGETQLTPDNRNQTYKFDVYTEQRQRHTVALAISTHAKHPKPATPKEVEVAVKHSKHLGAAVSP
jgi:hypothetical protein